MTHVDLLAAFARLQEGFERGLIAEGIRRAVAEEDPVGIFNEDGGARVTLGIWVHVII